MPLSKLGGIGIAMPGPCDYAKGIVAIYGYCKVSVTFSVLTLKKKLKKYLTWILFFINDASLMPLESIMQEQQRHK